MIRHSGIDGCGVKLVTQRYHYHPLTRFSGCCDDRSFFSSIRTTQAWDLKIVLIHIKRIDNELYILPSVDHYDRYSLPRVLITQASKSAAVVLKRPSA